MGFFNRPQVGRTLQASKEAGISSADKLQTILVDNGNGVILGTTPGFRAKVDLNQPAPSLQETGQQIGAQPSQDQTQLQPQQSQTRYASSCCISSPCFQLNLAP